MLFLITTVMLLLAGAASLRSAEYSHREPRHWRRLILRDIYEQHAEHSKLHRHIDSAPGTFILHAAHQYR